MVYVITFLLGQELRIDSLNQEKPLDMYAHNLMVVCLIYHLISTLWHSTGAILQIFRQYITQVLHDVLTANGLRLQVSHSENNLLHTPAS